MLKFKQYKLRLIYLPFIIILYAQTVFSQDTVLIAQEIQTALIALQEVQFEKEQLAKTSESKNASFHLNIKKLKATKRTLEAQVSEGINKKVQLLSNINITNKDIEINTVFIQKTVAHTQSAILQIKTNVDSGIAYQHGKRKNTLENINTQLSSANVVNQLNGTAAFLVFLQNELKLSNSVAFWNGPVNLLDNKQKHAYWVRLGLINQFYMSEDGQNVNLAFLGNQHELPIIQSLKLHDQVYQAISTMQQRRRAEISEFTFLNKQER